LDPTTLDDQAKSRGTCNGGTRHGKVVTLAETYAACVEQPIHRLTWAVTAGVNHIALGCDVSNAFAEAPPPKNPFYMEVDEQFQDWWTNCLQLPPIPLGWVIPILRNLQGHPEAPRLWHKHIDDILVNQLGFDRTTHEPCLYFKHHPEHGLILLLRQVDDFLISAKTLAIAEEVRQQIQSKMTNELNDLGIIKRFNGMDVDQTKHFVKLSCHTYIDKVIKHHGWENEKHAHKPIPMRTESKYLSDLETNEGPEDVRAQQDLERQMGFNYRQVIGEAIFAMTLCRIDIAPAVIKLSQYSSRPHKYHYQAAKALMVYLYATRNDGLYYWRPEPNEALPDVPLPIPVSALDKLEEYPHVLSPTDLEGASDSTWASDRQHRRSSGGIVFFYAGGAVYYRSRIHPTVAQSSTEAELAFMTDAGKAALYLRSILEELKLEQLHPTKISVDNRGARQLTNAQQPTKRTRHIDMRDFCILQWTEEEMIHYADIESKYNVSDSISKPTGRIKFYEQMDILMGRRKPHYVPPQPSTNSDHHDLHSHLQNLHLNDIDTHEHQPSTNKSDTQRPLSPTSVTFSTCSLSKLISITDLLDHDDLDDFEATSAGR
jgi:Reverse transcriptase (RNA-dependent DNA polymerase)